MRSSRPAARELMLFFTACETVSGEKRYTEFNWALLMELRPDNPGGRAVGMGDIGGRR